jgi:glyoxylase-like metal-dependent hydrolase (beta-lactamase superfamily II)
MSLPPIERFTTRSGIRLYRLPLEVFPHFIAYAYVVLGLDVPTLIDTGSGLGESNTHLLSGLNALHDEFGEAFRVSDLRRTLVTHGHIDHFGGLAFIAREAPQAEIGIHPLDRRILTAYEERILVATKDLRVYLERAGLSPESMPQFIQMYGFAKQHVQSVPTHLTLDEAHPLPGLEFIHTPGHCSGQICIRIEDILLTADHILPRTTPHQSPESITRATGIGHYLEALQRIQQVTGIRLGLGGHEEPMTDLNTRIEDIRASLMRKLERVQDVLRDSAEPLTIKAISKALYAEKQGYDILLALLQTGALVEYWYERGHLAVSNLDEVEQAANPALAYTLIE